MNSLKETKKIQQKLTKSWLKTAVVFALAITLISGSNPVTLAQDTGLDQLNAEKAERQKKLQQLNQQIKNFQQQISDAQGKSNTLQTQIFIFDKEIASTELQIEAKETQIEDTDLQIRELEKLIQKKQEEIDQDKKILTETLIELNEFDNDFLLKTTLSLNNLSDFLDQIQYTQNFQSRIYNILQKVKKLKAKLEADQKQLEIQLKNLGELKQQLEIGQEVLEEQRNQKQVLLTQTKGIERNFQTLLAASKKEESDIESEIEDLDRAIREKLGYKSVPAKPGSLAWPMDGILTQKYGNTGFTALGYDFHNGIDIAAPAGQAIYAAADGEVIYTDKSDQAYGNWVAIKHNISNNGGSSEIITLYAHFRSFIVSAGQKVKEGDLIGYEGNTGNTTKKLYGPGRGYHIHFGVYDSEGFGVKEGAYTHIYGHYSIPYGYTYNPLDFLE